MRASAGNYQPMPASKADSLLDDPMQTNEHGLGAVVADDHHLGVPRQHGHLLLAPALRRPARCRNHLAAAGSAPTLLAILLNSDSIPRFLKGQLASEASIFQPQTRQSRECTSGALEIGRRGRGIRSNSPRIRNSPHQNQPNLDRTSDSREMPPLPHQSNKPFFPNHAMARSGDPQFSRNLASETAPAHCCSDRNQFPIREMQAKPQEKPIPIW
jgi:hypothetical protein